MLNNLVRIVKPDITDEELSIINAFKGMGFGSTLIYLLTKFLSNKDIKFSNFEEFSKKHPEVKKSSHQKTYDILKNNNLEKDFNFYEKKVFKNKFTRYSQGVKFFSTVITSLLASNIPPQKVKTTFQNSLFTSNL